MSQRPLLADNILQLIGYTPLVRLHRVVPQGSAEVLAKLESFNPMWSVKDRIGNAMIEAAEREGKIEPGKSVVIEPTSGNTGIGLAMACAVKGYQMIFVMPGTVTKERQQVLLAFGATIVLTPGPKGMKGAIAKAQELLEKTPGGWIPQQFENPANVEVHRRTTAVEIVEATGGDVGAFVAGVGTGGTLTGTGSVLKQRIRDIRIVAVESADAPVLSGQPVRQPNRIQGISTGFIPSILDRDLIDDIEVVEFEDAIAMSRRLCREEGIFAGLSAGAVLVAALRTAQKLGAGKRVVCVLPDLGERYLSHKLYSELFDTSRILDCTQDA
ncbi:MAG: cysteine synthase A [Candidatus Wallbacteria bacterium]|nr:cysteine synthase A [Candidatus Wallbacteria bacterium]